MGWLYSNLFLTLFCFSNIGLLWGQVVKNDGVGVNTHQPTETLDINGTLRVRNLSDGSNVKDFPYTVVVNESGVSARFERSPLSWQLYDLDVNVRVNNEEQVPDSARTNSPYIAPSSAYEVKDSEVYVSIADKGSVITQVQWSTWFAWADLGNQRNDVQGTFRFYAKIQEVNENNALVGSVTTYSGTIGMASYYQYKAQTEYRTSVTVSFADKGNSLKKGKRYRIALLCGTEYDTNARGGKNNHFPIKNWGVSARGESYYKL